LRVLTAFLFFAASISEAAPAVLFDGLHRNLFFHDGSRFVEPVVEAALGGWRVSVLGPIGNNPAIDADPAVRLLEPELSGFNVVVIYLPASAYTMGELEALRGFVARGGGLLLVAENGDVPGLKSANQVAESFGAAFLPCVVAAPRVRWVHVLGEGQNSSASEPPFVSPRWAADLRDPFSFDARVSRTHPVTRNLKSLPVRAAGAVVPKGAELTPLAWVAPDPRVKNFPGLWLDRADPTSVFQPDLLPSPGEIVKKAVIAAALTSGRGRVILWADGLLGPWASKGYGGQALRETTTAFFRNALDYLAGREPSCRSAHAFHPWPGIPSPEQYVFFRNCFGRIPPPGRSELIVTGPGTYCVRWRVDPDKELWFSTGRATYGTYHIGRRRILVVGEPEPRVLNGDETTPDDWAHEIKTKEETRRRLPRYFRSQRELGMNHMADFPSQQALLASQIAAENGILIGTVYHGWMLKPVGSFGGPTRERLFVFRNLPDRFFTAQTKGRPGRPASDLNTIASLYRTPGIIFWNAGGGNEPTMAYLDGRSLPDLRFFRRFLAVGGRKPREVGASSWNEVFPHPLVDSYLDVSAGNVNPLADRILRKASDVRATPVGAGQCDVLLWYLSNRAALEILYEKTLSTWRLFKMFFPALPALGSHEADWVYFFDDIACARGGHRRPAPGEIMSIHATETPLAGLSYQTAIVIEIEQSRFPPNSRHWIRYKQFCGDRYAPILPAGELLEHAYAVALAHGACLFAFEKTHALVKPVGPEENRQFMARVNTLRSVWLNLKVLPSQVAFFRPGTDSVLACQKDLCWSYIAALRGFGSRIALLPSHNLEKGDLKRYKVLLLLGSRSIERSHAQMISRWVKRGGVVIGDRDCGAFDEALRPLGIFGDCGARGRERVVKLRVGSGRVYLLGFSIGGEERRLGANREVEALLGKLLEKEAEPFAKAHDRDVEVGVWDGGEVKYLVLVRHVPPPPPSGKLDRELVAPSLLEGRIARISLKGRWEVRCLLGPGALGVKRVDIPCTYKNGRTSFRISVPVRDLMVLVAVRPGSFSGRLEAEFENGRGKAGAERTACCGKDLRIRFKFPQSGARPLEIAVLYNGEKRYGRQLLLRDGKALYRVPFASNDPPGLWTLQAEELVSGDRIEIPIRLSR